MGAPDPAEHTPRSVDGLFATVYGELRALAHRRLQSEESGHTLNTTALVHEVYLKLSSQRATEYQNREQFFGLAAQAMRRILVDYARRHRAMKRPQSRQHVTLSALGSSASELAAFATDDSDRADFLIALDEALEELRELDGRLARVVEYRFFNGFTEAETAELLGVTARTIARDWVRARGWLARRLREDRSDAP